MCELCVLGSVVHTLVSSVIWNTLKEGTRNIPIGFSDGTQELEENYTVLEQQLEVLRYVPGISTGARHLCAHNWIEPKMWALVTVKKEPSQYINLDFLICELNPTSCFGMSNIIVIITFNLHNRDRQLAGESEFPGSLGRVLQDLEKTISSAQKFQDRPAAMPRCVDRCTCRHTEYAAKTILYTNLAFSDPKLVLPYSCTTKYSSSSKLLILLTCLEFAPPERDSTLPEFSCLKAGHLFYACFLSSL